MKSIKITLKPEEREAAIHMRAVRGLGTPVDFEGPDFQNAVDFVLSDDYVHVKLTDGTVYLYPHASIARIRIRITNN